MDANTIIATASPERLKHALKGFLHGYRDPAFGALPKGETELLVLRLLTDLGAVGERPTVYELVSKLKVTRTKARRLIYEQELRKRSAQQLDEEVCELLQHPIIEKSGELFVLEVESPLVSDHLRAKLHALRRVSDGSFSPSLVKLSLEAMTSLVESYLSEKDREGIKKALIAAGAPDTSLKGVLKAVLKKVGEKVADEAGEAVAEEASKYMIPILDGTIGAIKFGFKGLFPKSV